MAIENFPLPVAPVPLSLDELEVPDGEVDAQAVASQVSSLLGVLPTLQLAGHQLRARELTALTRDLLATMQLCESTVAAMVTNALERGIIDDSTAAGAGQWVARLSAGESLDDVMGDDGADRSGPLCPVTPPSDGAEARTTDSPHDSGYDPDASDRPRVPGIEPAHAARIAKVATACGERRNSVLAEALTAGRVGVPAARTALIEIDKVMPLLPSATRDDVFAHFLALDPGAGGRAIRELSRRVIATYADETFLHDLDERLDAAETVTWYELPNQMVRLVADLAPLHAAQLRHAIDALSSTAPGNECCEDVFHRHSGDKTGVADERSPGKRRADALMLLLTRSAELIDNDGEVTTSGSARLIVTVGFDELVGAVQGFGTTSAGTALEAHTIRRVACDADILPMVLGSDSQPLDVGRERRLVTPGQRAAVIQRDRHCTFPGCARPPTWCQVHHVVPWFAGGETSLDNSALLCPRHHTVVHRDGYLATVTETHVEWNLTPGRMPERARVA